MKATEVHEFFGGKWSHVARGLGLTESTVGYWRRKGYISYRTQLLIEKITEGKLVADKDDAKPEDKKA
jgi:hypothetical protein